MKEAIVEGLDEELVVLIKKREGEIRDGWADKRTLEMSRNR